MAQIIVWDIDRVWYPDISTTYVARGSTADYKPHLDRFVSEKSWFTYDDVDLWERSRGRKVDSVGALADMLTDFLYVQELRSEVYSGVSDQDAKTRTIEGKQALLKGVTIGELKTIADSVPYSNGFLDAMEQIRYGMGVRPLLQQVGFSDGLGPFVSYHMRKQGVPIGGIVPAVVNVDGKEVLFDKGSLDLLDNDSVVLLGKTGSFKKGEAIFNYLRDNSYASDEVVIIDDSAANIETLSKVRDGGGVAVGFNVNDRGKFEAAKIPVIKGNSVLPFAYIVANRSEIPRYCETWGVSP